MTGISDQFLTIGDEAVEWGTKAATLTRGIEHKPGNNPTHRVEHRASQGMRPGFLGDPTTNFVTNVRGGTIPVVADLLSKSHSMLIGSIGTTAITTPAGATTARLHTVLPSDHTLPHRSIHRAIAGIDGTLVHTNYLGGTANMLGLSIAANGNVEAKVEYDFRTVDTAGASVTPSYPSSPWVYVDTDVVTTLGGTAICQKAIDLSIPTGAMVTRDRICPGGREEPIVVGRVQPTGTLTFDYDDNAYLDDWLAGTSRSLVFEMTGPEIEAGFDYFVRVTFAAVKFTGDDSNPSLTDLTEQPLPWQAYDNGTDPLWKIEYQTTDTAI